MIIEHDGFKFDCEYTFHKGTVSGDYDVPDDPDELEITKVTIHRGDDDISDYLEHTGALEEIKRLIIEKL